MNNELLEGLRSVLKEELQPINKRLDTIEETLEQHSKRFDSIDQTLVEHKVRFDSIDQTLVEHKVRFDSIDQTLEEHSKRFDIFNQDLKDIKDGQDRLQKNLIQSLGDYTDKITAYVDNKTEVLNKRVYAVETEIQRLTRQ